MARCISHRAKFSKSQYCFANSTILRSNEPVSCKDIIDWSTSNPLRWFICNHKQYSLRAYDLVYFQHHVRFILNHQVNINTSECSFFVRQWPTQTECFVPHWRTHGLYLHFCHHELWLSLICVTLQNNTTRLSILRRESRR